MLIHCEVQGEYKSDFPHRMYTYFSRIFDKYGKRVSAYAILAEETTKMRTNKYTNEFLSTKLEYQYNVYKISQQSEAELLKSDNPFAMVVLTVRSVLKSKGLNDTALMEIKLKLARLFLAKSFPKEKIRMIMNFLKSYIHFENTENNIIFDKELQQITGRRTETMGLEEMILVERERRGMKQGVEQGMESKKREIIINMIQKKFTDEIIADIANVSLEYIEEIRKTLPN